MTNIYDKIMLLIAFLPFVLFVFLDAKANVKREVRNKQFFMPFVAVVFSLVLFIFMDKLSNMFLTVFYTITDKLNEWAAALSGMDYFSWAGTAIAAVAKLINDFLTRINIVYVIIILFNVCSMFAYLVVKKFLLGIFASKKRNSSLSNKFVSIFYDFDEKTGMWYIKNHFGQAKTFLKAAYFATTAVSVISVFISFYLCRKGLIVVPFSPVFSIIIMGELAFFIDGLEYEHLKSTFSAEIDNSRHITNYVILRKKLKELFGDKLMSDGTTLNDGIVRGGSIDQILEEIEAEHGKKGEQYAAFIRSKAKKGFKPDADYIRSGIELATGKSLLFNTPFYYKLTPYIFYAMHSALLKGGKVLVVLGRHGTSDDILTWCKEGLFEVTGLPSLWSIEKLSKEGNPCDIGIVTRSGVHDLELHKANREFLNGVSMVFLAEPSRLVTTAQTGLNLLVRNISVSNNAVYCSVDKNCDGLVDALSHILMTDITEVSATEFPEGTSSYMCWKADSEYLQHRITPGISRYLGMGTEISFTALKNQVENTIWYGGDAYPVLDQHWIAKQYYHDLLSTTTLPATQETFDKFFKVSFNICNERIRNNSFVSVEDEFFNLFEVKREFATIAKNQGFVNVISSDYMLRSYMTENNEIFIADPKAIPYISADYARTKRNIVLKICLQMSILGMFREEILKEFTLIGIEPDSNLKETLWQSICEVYCKNGENEIIAETPSGRKIFTDNVIIFKREFSTETGKFEDIFEITDSFFKQYVIDDLQSARYIAEKGNESTFLGTELKGHILQKYLPGQFITLSGKYYEMLSVSADNQVIVRRAADHINARYSYRQIRMINIQAARDNESMGMLKSVNGVKISNQFADFSVDTPAYWRMYAYNDFETARKVVINNVPQRKYINKHILKFDFSDFGAAFTKEVRTTITLLINEVFRTLFAENQCYIIAATAGDYEKPLTYSLSGDAVDENSIYIIEDSQLDIGLLVSVERNFDRIMQIISDYLAWNKSVYDPDPKPEQESAPIEDEPSEEPVEKPEKNPVKRLFGKIKSFFGNLFGKRKKNNTPDTPDVPDQDYMMIYGKPHKKVKGKWVRCSQKEFDEKMKKRHQAIEAKNQAEKAEKENESMNGEPSSSENQAEPVNNPETTDTKPSEEDNQEIPEEESKTEEKPVKKGLFGALSRKKNRKKKNKSENEQFSDEMSDNNDDSETVPNSEDEVIPQESAAPAEESDKEPSEEPSEESPEEPVEESSEETTEEPTEEPVEEPAEEPVTKKPKKKGFLGSLFGKKEKKSVKVQATESDSDEIPEPEEEQTSENTDEKEDEFDVSGV